MKLSLSRWERLEVNIFEALFAVLGLLMGLLVPFARGSNPEVSSSAAFYAEVGPMFGYLWAGLLVGSSLCVLVALWKPVTWMWGRPLEVFGLILFASLLTIQAIVIMLGVGGTLLGVVLRFMILPGFLVKVRVILRGEYIALVKPDA